MFDTPLPEEANFDAANIESMNAKAIENQFYTPDHVYIDFSLMKDIPLGVVYADALQHRNEEQFTALQADVIKVLPDYQKRSYDTVDPYLKHLGYTDKTITDLLENNLSHDQVFMVSPATHFFYTLIKHTVRNQNNSGPANKFSKKKLDNTSYTMQAMDVTYYFNTYPLNLSNELLGKIAVELGESFGVNIKFINKHPTLFDKSDWDSWLKKIECFYLNNLGSFNRNPIILEKQGNMELTGIYIFARKRFEKEVMVAMASQDFDQQVQLISSRLGVFCDFSWLQNNEARLTDEAEDVPFEDAPDPDNGTPS